MNGFSVASLTSTCSSISHRALSTAVEIDELRKQSPSSDDAPVVKELLFLGTKLLQFRQHTDILQECLGTASLISPNLQEVVVRSLRQCDTASAVLEKQIKRLHPQTLDRVNPDTLSVFEDLLVAYSRVFIFATQLLSV
ncbi:hypothetical protein CONLIGDRAFT_111743 [Coniochaeta ligniaria NRRL 30616]|uniref:Uncharacterized protein n=1 Tax=Coniochaeta ligniaria NRRL 30616 TaxID=1408157 RepID=A0A1J7I8N4_9PEZI|nr:hypothetical protein CONLIGDRAFT_111743 [Coniochaeta ligniaria NRRL 30616]